MQIGFCALCLVRICYIVASRSSGNRPRLVMAWPRLGVSFALRQGY
jgi:hypothetical protein